MAENYFSGGVAVVTGAGSGLGAGMVERFAAEGMSIVALDIDGVTAEATAQRIRDGGGSAIAMAVDVADQHSLAAAAKATQEMFGGCTVVCANVGVQQFGALDRLTEQDWQWVLGVNVMGVVHTVNAFLPLLRQIAGHRHIVITASSASLTPGVRMGAYTTSKYAVMGYGETLRMELADEGIGVSIMLPSGMITRHLESSIQARPSELGKTEVCREDIDVMLASRNMTSADQVATVEYATRHLVEDLAANQRYIITHGEYRDSLVAIFEQLLHAHDRGQVD
ncbi:SDR family NAD(P)-dependent oxidoreductase [Aestuariicella hydrocarbonica]|uniref:SDR family NAD(P)-dependent oxidoreductase n=1 Tax=Pseudomaricurvus hydrocarbonicus TaxID=1470433 RepID=A0A9E5MNA0_9GAMM|nr:SDR family NAD(P)-dependent oxidoreductase [Aestuariicella hydrocarbonica]NHO67406.1 SDR family NAD(P)-dependent oxidoreductase [Aestuariicella hydrocarbonica]